MVSEPRQLRNGFLYDACGLVLVVVGYYSYARFRFHSAGNNLPPKLAPEIQKSSEGYTFSKSDHGRTLFTIHAAKALEYKAGGRARLQDVTIIVYGKESNRFDQTYGSDFEYEHASDDVVAQRTLHIHFHTTPQTPPPPATP